MQCTFTFRARRAQPADSIYLLVLGYMNASVNNTAKALSGK